MKYRIEKDSPQETLIIPLFGRKICSEHFPELFSDPDAERICSLIDYDFESKRKLMESTVGLFGALEVAQRHFDLMWEVEDYLAKHPKAAVVNLGCGMDNTFKKVDNGRCRGYNVDLEDVINIRNEILPSSEREVNISCDLTSSSWMERINADNGAVFFASGVFYYLKKEDVRMIVREMSTRFSGSVLVFDTCNRRGAKMMTKTWIKEAGIKDVNALFSLDDVSEMKSWEGNIAGVSSRSYMRGYRDIYGDVGLIHKIMIRFCDGFVNMRIARIEFGENL